MFPFILLGLVGSAVALIAYHETRFRWLAHHNMTANQVETAQVEILLMPSPDDGSQPEGFELKIANRTELDIEIDWAETQYLQNGATEGGFIFTGKDVATQLGAAKSKDVVFAKQTLVRRIKPAANVRSEFSPMITPSYVSRLNISGYQKLRTAPLGEGRHGIRLGLRTMTGIEHHILAFDLEKHQIKPAFWERRG